MWLISIVFLFIVFLPLHAYGAGIVINEITWMGTAVSTANEWIELSNESSVAIDISGWRLEWRGGQYGITFGGEKCVNTTIQGGGYFLLERTGDDTVPLVAADCIYTGALSNSGEHLILKNFSGQIINEADASSGWPAGDNDTKETMQRSGNKWINATSTPRALNYVAQVVSSIPPLVSPQNLPLSGGSSTSGSLVSLVTPSVSVYAGEDLTATVGSNAEFLGNALGLKNEPLENARFWWNFGDGESAEGRSVSHIFQVPGKYTVGLHISSGGNAASDYMIAEIAPNQVEIASVLEGESGFIRLFNPALNTIDIGGWSIENSSGKKFMILSKTKIAAKSEIALTHSVTGLWQKDNFYPLIVRYPNAVVASKFLPQASNKNVSNNVVNKIAVASYPQGDKVFTNISDIKDKENKSVQSKSIEVMAKETPVNLKKDNFAGILPRALNSSSVFFLIAFIISFMAALGFIFTKKWINPKF